jgi:hypothetical protein
LNGRKCLFEHFKICKEKHKLPHDSKGRYKNPEQYENALKTRRKLYLEGKLNTTKGKNLSKSHKEAIKKGTKRFLEENKIVGGARYSVKACEYINKLNEEKNWNLQHALNGGEITVGPYYLDGYDKDLNIAFEYDENKHHYGYTEELSEKDIKKMTYIKEKLHCRFFRYNEKTDELKEW